MLDELLDLFSFIRKFTVNKLAWLGVIVICLSFGACQTIERPKPSYDLEDLSEFYWDNPPLDYIANCKLLIKTDEGGESGSCEVVITRKGQLRLTVSAPIGGTVMDIYIDHRKINIVDPTSSTYYDMDNSQENRSRIPLISDISINELRTIFWGRVFRGNTDGPRIVFENDLPARLDNIAGNEILVEYKAGLTYQGAWFPKTISISFAENQQTIKIVITKFEPGFADSIEIKGAPEGYTVLN